MSDGPKGGGDPPDRTGSIPTAGAMLWPGSADWSADPEFGDADSEHSRTELQRVAPDPASLGLQSLADRLPSDATGPQSLPGSTTDEVERPTTPMPQARLTHESEGPTSPPADGYVSLESAQPTQSTAIPNVTPPMATQVPADLMETVGPDGIQLEPETMWSSLDSEPPTVKPRQVTLHRLDLDTLPSHVRSLIDNVELELPARRRRSALASNARPSLGPYILLGALGSDDEDPPELENGLEVRKVAAPRRCVVRRMSTAELAGSSVRKIRFNAEAEVARRLDHPHLLRVYDSGEVDGRPYLVREFVQGVNARGLLGVTGHVRIEIPVLMALGGQIASALAYCHGLKNDAGSEMHLVHGAICPTALLIGHTGNARVTEMSLAAIGGRRLNPRTEARPHKSGYEAPEQVMGEYIGPRTDVFALGLVLTELLDGRPLAWDGSMSADQMKVEVARRCAKREDMPPMLTELLVEMTALKYDDRTSTANLVATALDDILYQLVDMEEPAEVLQAWVAKVAAPTEPTPLQNAPVMHGRTETRPDRPLDEALDEDEALQDNDPLPRATTRPTDEPPMSRPAQPILRDVDPEPNTVRPPRTLSRTEAEFDDESLLRSPPVEVPPRSTAPPRPRSPTPHMPSAAAPPSVSAEWDSLIPPRERPAVKSSRRSLQNDNRVLFAVVFIVGLLFGLLVWMWPR